MIKITCPSCRRVHKKTDESLLGKIVQCKDCGFTFKVSDGSQPVQWYWMLNGQMKGPIDVAGLKELVCSGHLKPTDMIKRKGADWVAASQVKGLFPDQASVAISLPVSTTASPKPAVSAETITSPSSPVFQTPPAPSEARSKPAIPADDVVRCPKCGSSSVTAFKKGFSGGKSCLGYLLLGPLGFLCGTCGGNKIFSVCMKCGHKWRIGK